MRTLLCMLMVTGLLNAQDVDMPKTHTVHLSAADSIVEANVYYQNPKLKVSQAKYYGWYRDDRVFFSQGGFDGKLLHGEYTCFFSDRKLKEKGEFKEGQRNGKWIKWYPNGVIRETCEYSGGARHGKYSLYSSGGQKVMSASYRHGMLNGEVIQYENGIEKSRKKYKEGVEIVPKPKPEPKSNPDKKEKVASDKWSLSKLFGRDKRVKRVKLKEVK